MPVSGLLWLAGEASDNDGGKTIGIVMPLVVIVATLKLFEELLVSSTSGEYSCYY